MKGIRCPVCDGRESDVIDVRDSGGNTRRRRRECRAGHRFSTLETVTVLRSGRGAKTELRLRSDAIADDVEDALAELAEASS